MQPTSSSKSILLTSSTSLSALADPATPPNHSNRTFITKQQSASANYNPKSRWEQKISRSKRCKSLLMLSSSFSSSTQSVKSSLLSLLHPNSHSNSNSNNNGHSKSATSALPTSIQGLTVIPEPVNNLLNQLYLRGPTTEGIFRKSPNARHCKELRHKLETDSLASIEQFQPPVIASVFKEWLRSLPDCLLMSRLYPLWIDAAKLIRHETNTTNPTQTTTATSDSTTKTPNATSLSAYALAERHTECLRIIRQLLGALNEPNLILLRSFVCVLWHIAQNSEQNKMSASNLGVCVGQSLLNDEHQSNGSGSSSNHSSRSTFTKRHQRSKSQSPLSSTLSLTSNGSSNSPPSPYKTNAQEAAKYVPILVAFMIENAPDLFGPDIADIFSANPEIKAATTKEESAGINTNEDGYNNDEQNRQQQRPLSASESTSSSRASSSTSGVYSESPAFSNELHEKPGRAASSISQSSPSRVSSSSPVHSTSPVSSTSPVCSTSPISSTSPVSSSSHVSSSPLRSSTLRGGNPNESRVMKDRCVNNPQRYSIGHGINHHRQLPEGATVLKQQLNLYPVYCSVNNVNTVPQNPYLAMTNPRRSHVMSLRDYYLTLQREHMRQQQQVYHNLYVHRIVHGPTHQMSQTAWSDSSDESDESMNEWAETTTV